MRNILQVTPFMNVDDFEGAVSFWRDLLGFQVRVYADTYAYVEREGAGVRIMENGPQYRGQPLYGKPFGYYFDVKDVTAIQQELTPKLAKWLDVAVHGPVDQAYGQRELMIMSPDGRVVVFGQAIEARPAGAKLT